MTLSFDINSNAKAIIGNTTNHCFPIIPPLIQHIEHKTIIENKYIKNDQFKSLEKPASTADALLRRYGKK